jgi:hypothetical protein
MHSRRGVGETAVSRETKPRAWQRTDPAPRRGSGTLASDATVVASLPKNFRALHRDLGFYDRLVIMRLGLAVLTPALLGSESRNGAGFMRGLFHVKQLDRWPQHASVFHVKQKKWNKF